jgi:hypothetical protein
MTEQLSDVNSIEKYLISSDAALYYDLVKLMSSSKHSGVLIPGLVPYVSRFITEATRILVRTIQSMPRA